MNMGCSMFSLSDSANSDLGSATFSGGELRSWEHASFGTTWNAVTGGIRELGFTINKEQKSGNSGVVEATGMSDRTVRIQLFKQGLRTTEVLINVGPIGDETISRLLLSKIQQRL